MNIFECLEYFLSWFPSLTGTIISIFVEVGNGLRTGDSVGSPLEVFNIPHYIPPHAELEYGIPFNATADVIRGLVDIQGEMRDEISFSLVTEVMV